MGLIIGQGTKSGGGGGGDVRLETNHNATLTTNGTHVVTPNEGYDGMRKATINVDVEAADPTDKALVNNATQYGLSHNLYNVMEQVKADPRTSGYAAIMLCQYYKGYNSLSLEGGANAFLTSDGDFYQGNAVHYWHDSNDEHFDRWVAMLFSSESGNYTCSNASICPRAALIDGTMGDINIMATNMRFAWIDVTNGSSFGQVYFNSFDYICSFNRCLLLNGAREIKRGDQNKLVNLGGVSCAVIGVKKISARGFCDWATTAASQVLDTAVFRDLQEIKSYGCLFSGQSSSQLLHQIFADELVSATRLFAANTASNYCAANLQYISAKKLISLGGFCATDAGLSSNTGLSYASFIHFEIGQGFYTDLNLRMCTFANCLKTDANGLVEDRQTNPTWSNLDQFLHNFEHLIVDKLADLSGQTAKTITLEAAPYAAITSEIRSKMSAKNWNLASA